MTSTYMNKALDLFLVFSKENCAEVNERLCGSEVMQMLLNLIQSFCLHGAFCTSYCSKVVQLLRDLATDPGTHNRLENLGII